MNVLGLSHFPRSSDGTYVRFARAWRIHEKVSYVSHRWIFVQGLSEEYDGAHDGGCVLDVTGRDLGGDNHTWSMATHNTTAQRGAISSLPVSHVLLRGSGHGRDVLDTLQEVIKYRKWPNLL